MVTQPAVKMHRAWILVLVLGALLVPLLESAPKQRSRRFNSKPPTGRRGENMEDSDGDSIDSPHFESKTLYPGKNPKHTKVCWNKCTGDDVIDMKKILMGNGTPPPMLESAGEPERPELQYPHFQSRSLFPSEDAARRNTCWDNCTEGLTSARKMLAPDTATTEQILFRMQPDEPLPNGRKEQSDDDGRNEMGNHPLSALRAVPGQSAEDHPYGRSPEAPLDANRRAMHTEAEGDMPQRRNLGRRGNVMMKPHRRSKKRRLGKFYNNRRGEIVKKNFKTPGRRGNGATNMEEESVEYYDDEEEEQPVPTTHFESKTLLPALDPQHQKRCWNNCTDKSLINMKKKLREEFEQERKDAELTQPEKSKLRRLLPRSLFRAMEPYLEDGGDGGDKDLAHILKIGKQKSVIIARIYDIDDG